MEHPLLADWMSEDRRPAKSAQHYELRVLCRGVGLDVNEQTLLRIHKPCPSLRKLIAPSDVRMIIEHH